MHCWPAELHSLRTEVRGQDVNAVGSETQTLLLLLGGHTKRPNALLRSSKLEAELHSLRRHLAVLHSLPRHLAVLHSLPRHLAVLLSLRRHLAVLSSVLC